MPYYMLHVLYCALASAFQQTRSFVLPFTVLSELALVMTVLSGDRFGTVRHVQHHHMSQGGGEVSIKLM